jgi:hypothetical protein
MEQVSAKRPGIIELVVKSWRSALGALLGMLPLFAVVTAALFALNYAFPILETKLAVIRPGKTDLLTLMQVPGAWLFALEKIALGVAAAPAILATMRHVLVQEGWRLSPGPMLRFWSWTVAVSVLSLGALYLSYQTAVSPGLGLVGIVLKLFAALLPLLLFWVFPAVAEGEPAAGIAARLDKALERWDGNFWRTIIVMTVAGFPAVLLQRLPAAIIMRRAGGTADAVAAFNATLLGSAVQAALTVTVAVIVASATAWCYYAAKMYRVTREPLGAAHEIAPPAAGN